MIYIVAGTMREAHQYAKEHNLVPNKDWRYVSGEHSLRGLQGPLNIVRTGTYNTRRDINHIEEAIQFIEAIYK